MFQPASAFIGLRYARTSRSNHFISFINMFSVIGISLGLMALITVSAVMNGFQGQLKERILGITPHIVVDTRAPQKPQLALDGLPGVVATTALIEAEGVVQSPKGLQGVLIQGIVPEDVRVDNIVAQNMLVGNIAGLRAGEFNLIIGRALALKLDIRVGERLRILTAEASVYTPFGRMYSQRIFKVAGIYDVGSELDDKVVMMHLHDAARLLRAQPESLQQTRLILADPFEYQKVVEQLSLPHVTWRARQGPLFDAVKMEKNMMALMLLLIIAVAAFNIVSSLVMVVTEKRGDIAILRTQGMTGRHITTIFVLNGLFNGIKGTFYGVAAGVLLVYSLNPLLALLGVTVTLGSDGQHLPIDIRWGQVTALVGLSILLSLLATLYPAYKALKVEPAAALKYE